MNASPRSICAISMYVLAFSIGTVSLYASRSLAAMLPALVLCSVFLAGGESARQRRVFSATECMAAALLLLAGLSIVWSEAPAQSLSQWWRIALMAGLGVLLARVFPRVESSLLCRVLDALCLGFVLLAAVLLLEWVTDGRVGNLIKGPPDRGLLFTSHAMALLSVIAWPVASWIAVRRGSAAAVVFVTAVLVAAALLPLGAALLAMLLAGIVWALSFRFRRATLRGVLICVWLVALGEPLALGGAVAAARAVDVTQTHSSWAHRLVIWQFFSERVWQRPILGRGLGLSKNISDDPQARAHYERLAESVGGRTFAEAPPLHPHNAVLQLWNDLGAVGVLVALALITSMFGYAARLPRAAAATFAASFAAWMVIACVSFGLWQAWWLASTGIIVANAAAVRAMTAGRLGGPVMGRGRSESADA